MSKILVVGAGRSSLGAAKLLRKLGKDFLISDVSEKYPEQLQAIKREGFPLTIGPQDESLLEDTSELIVSPGLPSDIPLLQAARQRQIPINSEIDLALGIFNGPLIGVTGTNGKSTTTTLIAHILEKLGISAVASGNIGVPPSFLLADDVRVEVFVMELSSYQLDFSNAIRNRCSIFTSFSQDHMERHKDMKSYFQAKWRLILATESSGLCIMPRVVVEAAKTFKSPVPNAPIVQVLIDREKPVRYGKDTLVVHFDTKKSSLSGDGIRGVRYLPEDFSFHNKLNLIYSILSVQTLQKTHWDRCLETVSTYSWLPFRFQKIGTWMGYPVFNDSKSTNVESTVVALESVQKPCILLLGGLPKGESYKEIGRFKSKIATLITFGAASARIADDLEHLNPHQFSTLKDALQSLPRFFDRSPGPVVFSPACSSFDEFQNFEDRGDFFNQQIRTYANFSNNLNH